MTHRTLVWILVCTLAPLLGYALGALTIPDRAPAICPDDTATEAQQRAIKNAWRHPPHEETSLL